VRELGEKMYCSPEGLQKKKERGKKRKKPTNKTPHFSIGGQEKKMGTVFYFKITCSASRSLSIGQEKEYDL